MKFLKLIPLFFCLSAIAWGEDLGIIECRDRTSISAVEKPESIVVVGQLSCGQKLTIIGMEKGYAAIQIKKNLIGYVDENNIRRLQQNRETPAEQIKNQEEPKPQPNPPKSSMQAGPAEDPYSLKDKLGVAFDAFYLQYTQPDRNLEKKGMMFGFYGDYVYPLKQYRFKVDGDVQFGNIEYIPSQAEAMNSIRNLLFESRFTFGRLFGQRDNASVTPYSGLGFRYLSEETGGKVPSQNVYGHDRRSNYLYSPIGVEFTVRMSERWIIIPTGEYDLLLRGYQFTRFNDGNRDLPNIKNIQKSGYGIRRSIAIVNNYGRIDYFIEPYVKYWNFKDSEGVDLLINSATETIIEPAHNSKEWGVRLGVKLF